MIIIIYAVWEYQDQRKDRILPVLRYCFRQLGQQTYLSSQLCAGLKFIPVSAEVSNQNTNNFSITVKGCNPCLTA